MKNQREFWFLDHRYQSVRGYFYLDGKRVRRRLCSFTDAGLDAGGHLLDKTPRGEKMLTGLLDRLHREIERSLLQGEAERKVAGQSFKALWQEWVNSSAAEKAPGTIAYYIRTGNEYLAGIGDHPITDFTLRHSDKFLTHLSGAGLSNASINIRLQNLKAFLRWCYEREEIEKIPPIKQLRRDKKLPKVFAEVDIKQWVRMLQAVRRHRKGSPPITRPNGKVFHPGNNHRRSAGLRERFIRVAFDSGCRLSELFYLRLDQFDTDAGLLHINFQARFSIKEKREKVIPMPRRLCRYIRAIRKQYPEERFLLDNGRGGLAYSSPDSFTTQLQRDLKTLGFAGRGVKVAHGFRSLYAHRLRERGAPLDVIKNLLGHSNITVTEAYFPASQTQERAAVALLE